MALTVDAHLHLWDLDRVEYPWITADLGALHRTFTFAEVEPQLDNAGIDRVILVQAANSIEDSAAMFAVAEENDRVAGVVAWVDLLDPARTATQLDQWAAHPALVGVRHLIHDEPDPDWLARDAVRASLAELARRGLVFDIVGILPRHLELALAIAGELPELRLVIDHLGTPPIGDADAEPWAGLLTGLATHPNVAVKLSGLTTLGPDAPAGPDRLRPYVNHVLEAFGAGRVLFGGDWPVSTAAGNYAQTQATAAELVASLSPSERADVFGGAADRAYRLS
ncbi:amidohydrolase family protein [Leifsonia poae]|uniref:amidohydrolase family protein n=1 Tax=Leifsonia poae TaxID=110933 RepID=UPI001CBE5B5B|nr:amidohydrolase family protein [Leifsonia poae]